MLLALSAALDTLIDFHASKRLPDDGTHAYVGDVLDKARDVELRVHLRTSQERVHWLWTALVTSQRLHYFWNKLIEQKKKAEGCASTPYRVRTTARAIKRSKNAS